MKPRLMCVLALSSSVVALATEFQLAFPEQKIELPSLSLQESVRQNNALALPIMSEAWKPRSPRPKVSADKFVVTPPDNVDYKLTIKEPDPTFDYRLIVKDPKFEFKK